MSNKTITHKMDKETFLSIFNENITVKEQKRILGLIQQRFQYIVEKLIELHGVKLSWYDFDNETGSDGDEGYFDPELYKESTCFEGEWGGTSGIETDELCDQEFPNRWYYEDFEDEVANELKALLEKKEQEKVEARDRKAKKQQRREEMKAIIRSKLTLEELSFIKFK